MRTKIVVICVVVCAVLVLFFAVRRPTAEKGAQLHSVEEGMVEPQAATERQLPESSGAAEQPPSAKVSPDNPFGPFSPEVLREDTNAFYQWMLWQWQAPIDFYGKVVDENGNPVKGAKVTFRWNETPPAIWDPDFVERLPTVTTESDEEGLFSLRGKKGQGLCVWVSKEGYYASRGGYRSFTYAIGPNIFTPDPQNPVVFQLRKKGKGEPLIKRDFPPGIGQIAKLRSDGTPVEIDLLNGQKVSEGNGHLKLEFWQDAVETNARVYNWKCRLSVPGGGLVETEEEFDFQAPEGGYKPSIDVEMPATTQNWQSEIRRKYFIQLGDGKYGRIEFYLLSRNGVFTIQSFINPSGSRNLEPAN